MPRHRSEDIIDDIVGGFKIFVISAILIYVALVIVNTLYPNFPIKENSWWAISLVLGLLLAFGNYIKKKNKSYFGR